MYKPFEVMEKISVAILTTQELIISIVYLVQATRILQIRESLQRKGNHRRIRLLVLANIAIIALDVVTITLEYLALWGVWCSFKGFGYSVKLKIEFAILNQLRDSVKSGSDLDSYNLGSSTKGNALSLRSPGELSGKGLGLSRSSMKRQPFEKILDEGRIAKTTEIDIKSHHAVESRRVEAFGNPGPEGATPESSRSSEVEFAHRGV